MKGLQIGAGFTDYKSGARGITNRVSFRDFKSGKEIANRVRNFKLRQRNFKSG